MEIPHGQIVAFSLFDIAEAIDVRSGGSAISTSVRATFAPKPATPAYLRYQEPPLQFDGAAVDWNGAFVCDTPAGAHAALETVEFANSQLLQFRYYDELLDNELASIYANIKKTPHWYDALLGRHYARAARQVHALFIDVNKLTDRTENALKIVGDVYAARLLSLVGADSVSIGGRRGQREVENTRRHLPILS